MRDEGIADETIEFWRLWMNALRSTQPRLLAYLSYMMQRLAVMKRLLRPSGSVYLHCDSTASYYIKVMMDGIWGHDNFRNEIIWRRTNAHPLSIRKFEAVTDTLLLYTRTNDYVFHGATTPMSDDQIGKLFNKQDERGRFASTDLTGGKAGSTEAYKPFKSALPSLGRAWAPPALDKLPSWAQDELGEGYLRLNQLDKCHMLDEVGLIHWTRNGKPRFKRYLEGDATLLVPNLWTDIKPASGDERLGYATQKPLALLERIIKASTNEGDVIMDPFCGCATTIEAAHKLNRQWIGIDIAIHAIKRVAAVRLGERCHLQEGTDFMIDGVPRSFEGAKDLWERDTYHFQKWAVEEVDGFVTTKRTADGGIDGRLYFEAHGERDLQSMILEVKGGENVTIADLRALHSVLEREEAMMAGLIVMEPLGDRKMKNFQRLISEVGDLELEGLLNPVARMQILSVSQILDGERFRTPSSPVGRSQSLQQRLAL